MWKVYIRDQTACSVQSDLDLHSPQKLLVSSSVREELIIFYSVLFVYLLPESIPHNSEFNNPVGGGFRKHCGKRQKFIEISFIYNVS